MISISKEYKCNINNYRVGRKDKIKYIVIHYVGASGSALNNAKYYANNIVGASAHYFVGHAKECGAIYQSVSPENTAWHCGAKTYKHNECRNENSIGIELCCHLDSKGNWFFDDITIQKAMELTKYLMKIYNIDIKHVIRHYDVTGKECPKPFLNNDIWNNVFLNKLKNVLTSANDITWELNNSFFPISDSQKFVKELEEARQNNSSLYWGYYKLVNRIK